MTGGKHDIAIVGGGIVGLGTALALTEQYPSYSVVVVEKEAQPAQHQNRDMVPGGSGVRAQAVTKKGLLVDDFRIIEAPNAIHVLNAPSPAATASIAIGRHIAGLASASFGLKS